MIGCDGPCEDWFHLKCVDMTTAKTKLVQKWYCPNCAALGHETLWKRMCRLVECSEPARQEGKVLSKYCSDEHGLRYMSNMADPKGAKMAGGGGRRRHTNTAPVTEEEEDNSSLRGGVLKPSELKTLSNGVKDIDEFHRLGSSELSTPSPPTGPTIPPPPPYTPRIGRTGRDHSKEGETACEKGNAQRAGQTHPYGLRAA